jgi:hypothetical protein
MTASTVVVDAGRIPPHESPAEDGRFTRCRHHDDRQILFGMDGTPDPQNRPAARDKLVASANTTRGCPHGAVPGLGTPTRAPR